MTMKTARLVIVYGVFLIAMGVMGYLSNPEKAKTALMSGGLFGSISILWGVLGMRGFAWSRRAALATTSFLALVFSWRATVSWMAVASGDSEKQFAAGLISAMLAGSLMLLPFLLKGGARAGAGASG